MSNSDTKTINEKYCEVVMRAKNLRERAETLLASNDRDQAKDRVAEAFGVLSSLPNEDGKLGEEQACAYLMMRINYPGEEEAARAELETAKADIVDLLKTAGISSVEISYDGAGDSGQIGRISVGYADGSER